ncbi:MAG: hypothetical protein ACEPO8_15160 [Rhodothermaceae bacterium]
MPFGDGTGPNGQAGRGCCARNRTTDRQISQKEKIKKNSGKKLKNRFCRRQDINTVDTNPGQNGK